MSRRGFLKSFLSFGAFQTTCMAIAGVRTPIDLTASTSNNGPIYAIEANEIYFDNIYYELESYFSIDRNALEMKRKEIAARFLEDMVDITDNCLCFSDYLLDRSQEIKTVLKSLRAELRKIKQTLKVTIENDGEEIVNFIDSITPATSQTVEIYERYFEPLFRIVEKETQNGVLTVEAIN